MIEYKHLTDMDLDFLGEETRKVVSNMPVLNSRSKKLNIHEIMGPVSALIENIRDDKTRHMSDDDLRQKIGSELLVYCHLYYLSQYPEDPYACMKEFKNTVDWISKSNLTVEQNETLRPISAFIGDSLDKLKGEDVETEFLRSIKSLNFLLTSAKLKFDSEDPRYAAIDEISMLGSFVIVFGEDHYHAFKSVINESHRRKMELNKEFDIVTQKKADRMEDGYKFDRSTAEDAVQKYIELKLGMPLEIFLSNTPGVVAMERPSYIDEDKIDLEELAEFVSTKVGIEVVAIDHCDWTFDDDCDQEALCIAFDVPDLEPEYRSKTSNLIKRDQPTPMKT